MDGVALGFADLLQDHLLGGLRGNSAQHVCRLGGPDLRADLRRGILLTARSASDISFSGSFTSSTTFFTP